MKTDNDWYAESNKKDEEVRRVLQTHTSLTLTDVRRALLADKNRSSRIRLDEFHCGLGSLIRSASTSKLFPGDRTQPSLEDIVYTAVREAVWRLAEQVGGRRALEVAEGACEVIELTFGKDEPDDADVRIDD